MQSQLRLLIFARTSVQQVRLNLTDIALYKTSGTAFAVPVFTKGGITEVGSQVIYDGFPKTADEMFEKTLEKRKQTAENATKAFNE